MRCRNGANLASLCVTALVLFTMVGIPLAGQKRSSNQALPIGTKESFKLPADHAQQPPKKPVADAMPKGRLKGAKADGQVTPERKSALPRASRAIKLHKNVMPKATVQPRTDLSHYGMLEDSQRYDPRPNPRQAGVPNPQNSDLTHDHFQELDRNQDGMIDPVERAFGRIDMDRDLHTRTLR